MGTRAENRRVTLLRLGEAAIDLFEEQGTTATIADIAARAGTSRRTVFRYVDGKEELAFVHPMLWFDVFDEGLRAAADVPMAERLATAAQAIAAHIDRDPGPARRAFLVAAANPELLRGFNTVYQQWVDRVVAEVLAGAVEPKAPTADERFRARIVGSAIMGVVDAVTREWAVSVDRTFSSLFEQGLAHIAPLLATLPADGKGDVEVDIDVDLDSGSDDHGGRGAGDTGDPVRPVVGR